jgi:subtilisin family serine protease
VNVKKILVIVLAVILALTLLLTSFAFAGGGKKEVVPAQMVLDASLSEVSTAFDTPKANLEVARSREFTFGGDKFLLSSIVDKKSKQAYMVSTDAQGKVWIAEPKIEDELIDYMSHMKPDETVPVSIWTIYVSPEEELLQIPSNYPDIPFEGYYPAPEADVSPEVLDAIEADITEIKLRANEEAVQPVVDFLRFTGCKIDYISQYAPLVFAELSKEAVYKLARLAEVKRISLPEEPELCMYEAARTIRAIEVWQKGYDGGMSNGSGSPTGRQTRVAVVDSGVDFDHDALEHANGGTCPGTTICHWHGTAVAGCVASDDDPWPDYKGIAPGTLILDANDCGGGWDKTINAIEWAIRQGANIINFSQGAPTDGEWYNDCCEYFDSIADEHKRLPVVAAGNDENWYVSSPANAWNVLAVGGIDDKNDWNWQNDTFASFSSWRNPNSPYFDREKPEVCAPAVDITMPAEGTEDDFRTESGTSFAAPQVAGIAALLIEKNYGLLYWRPALTKAIIMASANHDVVTPNYPGKPMDDKEGVGTVNAAAAMECLENGWTWSAYKYEEDLPFFIEFEANQGETVRFVISWYAHTGFQGLAEYELRADLGLSIWKQVYPGVNWWSPWKHSISYDSAWEIIEFTAPYTGIYKARIYTLNRDGIDPWKAYFGEYINAAWYRWTP